MSLLLLEGKNKDEDLFSRLDDKKAAQAREIIWVSKYERYLRPEVFKRNAKQKKIVQKAVSLDIPTAVNRLTLEYENLRRDLQESLQLNENTIKSIEEIKKSLLEQKKDITKRLKSGESFISLKDTIKKNQEAIKECDESIAFEQKKIHEKTQLVNNAINAFYVTRKQARKVAKKK